MSSLRLNEHFDPPKTVSSIFTGRKTYLDGLKEAFDNAISSSETGSTQKRFVVFGLGGSGKTQFSCKFASDNKQR
jgi:ATP-dependent phosphoenolpyruvate carboxykinase